MGLVRVRDGGLVVGGVKSDPRGAPPLTTRPPWQVRVRVSPPP